MKIVGLGMLLVISSGCLAALPPRYQHERDLDVLVAFVKAHPGVLATLESIDVANQTVHYRQGCMAIFGRRSIQHEPGWAGPAAPLELKHTTCDVGD